MEKNLIENIILKSGAQVKEYILEKSKVFEKWPKMRFGRRDHRCNGAFSAGIADKVESGVLIHEGLVPHGFFEDTSFGEDGRGKGYIILLPKGLYSFRKLGFYAINEVGTKTNFTKDYPDWNTKEEIILNYLIYGNKTLEEISKLKS